MSIAGLLARMRVLDQGSLCARTRKILFGPSRGDWKPYRINNPSVKSWPSGRVELKLYEIFADPRRKGTNQRSWVYQKRKERCWSLFFFRADRSVDSSSYYASSSLKSLFWGHIYERKFRMPGVLKSLSCNVLATIFLGLSLELSVRYSFTFRITLFRTSTLRLYSYW